MGDVPLFGLVIHLGQLTCGRHNAMFLSAPNARTPDSSQSAAEGCLLAPAAR